MIMSNISSLQTLLFKAYENYPKNIAIVSDEQFITYEELIKKISIIAFNLKKQNFPNQYPVVIYGHKSIEFICTMYACILIGQPYIPLQEIQPHGRIQYVLQDSYVSAFLYHTREDKTFLNQSYAVLCIAISDLTSCVNGMTHHDFSIFQEQLQEQRKKSHPIFTLYTSGSTGTPKGVIFNQVNVLNFINWAIKEMQMVCNDRVASFAPLHFDLSTFDIFSTLSVGATVYFVPEEYKPFPATLVSWLNRNAISVVYMVPTAIISILKKGNWTQEISSNLRLILFAGEQFPLSDLCALRALFPFIRLINLYGPTETNVCSWYEVPNLAACEEMSYLSIGLPIDQTELYIVNNNGDRLSALYAEGELYCVGPSVSIGYVRDQWSERFFIAAEQRGFRTGDIVKIVPEGFVFLHRKDRQIKRNGYRIDISEIESCLRQHPMVHNAAVINKNNLLIAFLECSQSSAPTSQELHDLCRNFLHKIMHPDEYLFLQNLPRTATEKINYQALLENIVEEVLL